MNRGQGAAVFLKQCTALASHRLFRATTILGSCVAVTFRHEPTGWAGIFHALLPGTGRNFRELGRREAWRFTDASVERMHHLFARRGVTAQGTEVKVFGGSDMFGGHVAVPSVGEQNVRAALGRLKPLGYTVSAMDLGGPRGRKIIFCSATGRVFLKRL